MIARERLRTSRMRSCFRSILVDPPTGAVPAGPAPSHFWSEGLRSPDIEMPSHLFGVIKHSRQRDAPQLLNCETSKNSSGKASSQFAKEPSPEELDHGFLWREHKQVPGKGELTIFNRSHYEGVLIERVHKIVPEEVWSHRYRQINDFERILSEENTTILKFYLHIDKDEQKKRLQQRLDDPSKRWKFSGDDLPERKFWKEYMKAYEDALNKTSTEWAPWYLIPSSHKWYRDLVVSRTIVKAMEKMNLHYPKTKLSPSSITIE